MHKLFWPSSGPKLRNYQIQLANIAFSNLVIGVVTCLTLIARG